MRYVQSAGALAIAIILASFGVVAQEQRFPSKPVVLIVPWPAGGTTDVAMRALASATEKHLHQPIVIENRPGAGGTLGPIAMATMAKPDGYTISQIPMSLLRVQLMRKTDFDPATDLTYVIGLTGYVFGVVVKADAPWRTFSELLADARSRPINYGSPGTGTTPHITMKQIALQQRVRFRHVPFKGSADTINALLGGHLDAVADGSSWGPFVNSGQLRLLVTFGDRRSSNWPGVPTLRELGIDVVAQAPYGIAGPKGMTPQTVKTLHDAFRRGMSEPSYRKALKELDQEEVYLNSEDYHNFVQREIKRQAHLFKAVGLDSN